MRKLVLMCGILLLFTSAAIAQDIASIGQKTFSCAEPTGILCAEVYQPIGYHGAYTGHDEPSVLFYSRFGQQNGLPPAIAQGPAHTP